MYKQIQERTFELLHPRKGGPIGLIFDWFITVLIAANVAAVMLSTVDSLAAQYGWFFYTFELFSVIVFTAEYLGRVWSAVQSPAYTTPIAGRLSFMKRPFLVIDLLAILPFYFGAFFIDLRFLRALRLFRFFRLFKLARYSESMRKFGRVLRNKKEDLLIGIASTTIILIVASSLMYFVERSAQPEAFSSIPAALWWGAVTLTTVGYGDVYPVTPLGRALGVVIAVLGIGLFALPASILASGFVDEISTTETCPYCGEELPD